MRSGTLPTPLIVGLGMACQVAKNEMAVCTLQLSGIVLCITSCLVSFILFYGAV